MVVGARLVQENGQPQSPKRSLAHFLFPSCFIPVTPPVAISDWVSVSELAGLSAPLVQVIKLAIPFYLFCTCSCCCLRPCAFQKSLQSGAMCAHLPQHSQTLKLSRNRSLTKLKAHSLHGERGTCYTECKKAKCHGSQISAVNVGERLLCDSLVSHASFPWHEAMWNQSVRFSVAGRQRTSSWLCRCTVVSACLVAAGSGNIIKCLLVPLTAAMSRADI